MAPEGVTEPLHFGRRGPVHYPTISSDMIHAVATGGMPLPMVDTRTRWPKADSVGRAAATAPPQ